MRPCQRTDVGDVGEKEKVYMKPEARGRLRETQTGAATVLFLEPAAENVHTTAKRMSSDNNINVGSMEIIALQSVFSLPPHAP